MYRYARGVAWRAAQRGYDASHGRRASPVCVWGGVGGRVSPDTSAVSLSVVAGEISMNFQQRV